MSPLSEDRLAAIRERLNNDQRVTLDDSQFLLRCVDGWQSMVRQRIDQVDQLKDLLRRLEWRGCVEHFECPACGQRENKGGHDPECWLWLAIRTA